MNVRTAHRCLDILKDCFSWDRPFRRQVLQIMLPVLLQQILAYSIGLADSLMVTGMGNAAYAAVVQANLLINIFQRLVLGIQNAAFIFLAQFAGAGDGKRLKQVLGMMLFGSGAVSLLSILAVLLFPETLLSIFLRPGESFAYAKEYLAIAAWSFLPFAINGAYTVATRASGVTWTAMVSSMANMIVNLLLNYLLINGRFGFPALGVKGAAIATVTAMVVSMLLSVILPYRLRLPAAAKPREWLGADRELISRYLKMLGPFIVQDLGWMLGNSMYSVYFGHMGDAVVATYSVANTLNGLIGMVTAGLNQAANIMVGSALGRSKINEAYKTGKRLLAMVTAASLLLGLLLVVFRRPVISLFTGLSAEVHEGATALVIVTSLCYVLRVLPGVLLGGILRSGGDTRFSCVTTCWTMWLVAVPATALAAFVFHLPLPLVVFCTYLDEIIKTILGFRKYVSMRWAAVLTVKSVAESGTAQERGRDS